MRFGPGQRRQRAGDFEIEISAPGYEDQTQAVTVAQGECHVVGQSLDVVLEEADCNDDAIIPSIILTLLDNGSPLTLEDQAWAQWGRPDVDIAGAPCEPGVVAPRTGARSAHRAAPRSDCGDCTGVLWGWVSWEKTCCSWMHSSIMGRLYITTVNRITVKITLKNLDHVLELL